MHDFSNAEDVPCTVHPSHDCSCLLLAVSGDGRSRCRATVTCNDTDACDVGLGCVGDFVDLHACIYDSMKVLGLR